MNKNDVLKAIDYLRKYKTETDRIEAKTASGGFPKKCYDTFSSFSNKYGGIIIFGLSQDKLFSTEGVYDLADLQKQISNLCSDSMEPTIRPDILAFEFEGKNILAVKIENSDLKFIIDQQITLYLADLIRFAIIELQKNFNVLLIFKIYNKFRW